jgi:regulator of cell morphogenesis and NO signaling
MITALTTQSTIGEFILDRPARARIFEHLGIGYCCGAGKTSLSEACRRKGLDPDQVLAQLQGGEESAAGEQLPSQFTLTQLADHIEQTHHAWLRKELPRIHGLVEKVARAHGTLNPWVVEIRKTFRGLHDELFSHMAKEEQILFPFIRRMESGLPLTPAMTVGIDGPVRRMEHEHESAINALESMRRHSDDYTPPEGACNTFRAMLDALSELESDMKVHIHKENDMLFPRAVEKARGQNSVAGN